MDESDVTSKSALIIESEAFICPSDVVFDADKIDVATALITSIPMSLLMLSRGR